MSRHLIDVGSGRLWLDIGSYARHGPGRRDRLSPAQIEVIARTVHRTPEVMVKVLNRGGQNLGAVARHIDYLTREGELEIETARRRLRRRSRTFPFTSVGGGDAVTVFLREEATLQYRTFPIWDVNGNV